MVEELNDFKGGMTENHVNVQRFAFEQYLIL